MNMKSVSKTMPTVAVVVCTYNSTEALRLCLYSLTRQTRMPDEVVIADDGSTTETKAVVDGFRGALPIKHVWHEDLGFRRAMILNRAFAACTSDYIIQVDGDIVMERHFVADHVSEARRGYFLNGSRGKLGAAATAKMKTDGKASPHFYSKGLKRRLNTVRVPLLTPLFHDYKKHKKVRGCNMSFWRKDLYAVNGYDNGMIGYGSEDVDIAARLLRLGIRKRFVKFKAIEFHLYHPESSSKSDEDSDNHKLFVRHNEHGTVRVDDGIDRFLTRN